MHRSVLFILIGKVCSSANSAEGQPMLDIVKRYENPNSIQLYQNQNNQIVYPWQMEQNINPMNRSFENDAATNTNCCINFSCRNPCFPPAMYSMSAPIIVPARTVFEPVVHNHPPLHKIKRIIRKDRKRWRIYSSSSSSSSNEFSTSN